MAKKKRQTNRRPRPADGITLPEFNLALGEFLALPAHLEQKYSDVVTQIFPLKASMNRLQEFCDSYLNLDEESAAPLQTRGSMGLDAGRRLRGDGHYIEESRMVLAA